MRVSDHWSGLLLLCPLLLGIVSLADAAPAATAGSAASPGARIVIIVSETDRTHIQFSDDLKKLGALHGVDIAIKQSHGSLENLMSIVKDDQVNVSFLQADVPAWIAGRIKEDDRPSNPIRQFFVKVKTLYPLDDEWVQIVARQDITSLAALKGRKVAIGPVRSGSFLTMGRVFQDEGIKFEPVPVAGSIALTQLQAGEVDAVAMVAAYPITELQEFQGAGYHLLPVVLTNGDPVYTASTIPVNTYPWQQEAVPTIAIKVFLVTFDYPPELPICKSLWTLSSVIKKNIPWLRTNGHANWQRVDLNYSEGWSRSFLKSHCMPD